MFEIYKFGYHKASLSLALSPHSPILMQNCTSPLSVIITISDRTVIQ